MRKLLLLTILGLVGCSGQVKVGVNDYCGRVRNLSEIAAASRLKGKPSVLDKYNGRLSIYVKDRAEDLELVSNSVKAERMVYSHGLVMYHECRKSIL